MALYSVQRRETQNRKMHLYLGSAKSSVEAQSGRIEWKYFVRSIVRHSDLISKVASFEYVQMEIGRALVDAMDELDIAVSVGEASANGRMIVQGNHVFLNFIAPLLMFDDEIVHLVTDLMPKFSSRLWKLCILQVELKFLVQQSSHYDTNAPKTLRIHISNNRNVQEINVYTEAIVDKKV